MLQFRKRTARILTCQKEHEHSLFTCDHVVKEVTEAIGTGLAIEYATSFVEPVSPLAPETAYGLVHLASGTILTRETAPTIVCAAMWLRKLLPLFDWTLPHAALKPHRDLAEQVHWTLIEVVQEYHVLLLRCGERTGALWYTA